jgi:hypothetical protein
VRLASNAITQAIYITNTLGELLFSVFFNVDIHFMFRLFRCKMIFEKWFRYFSVFGRGKNNGQPKNDFRLAKNA